MDRSASARVSLLLALGTAAAVLAGCSIKPPHELTEGMQTNVGGLHYTVFITRELNLRDPEDHSYYQGKEAPRGSALYGVFLRVCNDGHRALPATGDMQMVDSEGHVFKPKQLPAGNAFAYRAAVLAPHECIPAQGSPAEYAPTSGAMQLYQIPLGDTENRPIDLEIKAPPGAAVGEPQHATVVLDF